MSETLLSDTDSRAVAYDQLKAGYIELHAAATTFAIQLAAFSAAFQDYDRTVRQGSVR